MKHVILEGPEGSGKSTLAKKFTERYGFAVQSCGAPPADCPSVRDHYAKLLLDATRPTVFDRHFLSQLVYGPLLRGSSGLSDLDVTLLTRLITALGTTIIYCDPGWDACDEHASRRDDRPWREDAYQEWARFADAWPGIPSRWYNWQSDTALPSPRLRETCCPPEVIGSPHATVLIMGDRSDSPTGLPFFSPRFAPLHACLDDTGPEAMDIAFINLQWSILGGSRDMGVVLTHLSSARRVIAVGESAAARWRAQHLAYRECSLRVIPDVPEDMARLDEYAAALRDACQ